MPSVEDGSFNFVDYIDKPVAQLLYQWSLSVYNPRTGQIGLARNLKGTIEIRQYTPDGNVAHGNASFKASNPSRTWLLKGAWPKSVKFGDFSY
ncbi:MAG: hypothetical protein QW303_09235 [Nitrososphaerota archaeon]